jgi:hypothetical protein
LGRVLRGLGDPEMSSGGLRGILVRLGGVLGEFWGILGGLGFSSRDLGGLGFGRTRPRVETVRCGRSGRQALRVLGKSAHAYARASGRRAARVRVRVVGKARERHQTAPDLNGSRRSLFASCEEFGGGLSDTLSSSTGNNINFRATLLKRDLRCEVLGISHQHLARSGPRGMERRKRLAEIISRNYTGKLERLWGS